MQNNIYDHQPSLTKLIKNNTHIFRDKSEDKLTTQIVLTIFCFLIQFLNMLSSKQEQATICI